MVLTITQIIDLSCTSQSLQSVDAASVNFIIPFFLHENYQQAMFIFYIQGGFIKDFYHSFD